MTKINRITIHGFKSFAHKTDILFDDKFNCILGPNGSGKSNIGDALCFVLGRLSAKSLRAEKASNLIFNGGKNKKPAEKGMVEVAFSNENKIFPVDEKEMVITRIITKTGNSKYKINGKTRTRTEIIDTLASAKVNPDGYNIILQGDITRFVTMSPLERRRIIEEISDVAVYEEKKHKALLEMNKVEEKLNNAEIILKERKNYLKELKKDRDQALKFKELKDKIDSNKATFIHLQIAEKEEVKGKFDEQINKQQVKIDESQKKIDELKKQIAEHKENVNKINHEIEQKGEKEQLKVHREIEDLKVNITRDKTRVSTLKDEINKIKQRKDQFAEEIKELEAKNTNYSAKQKELEQSIVRKTKEKEDFEQKIAEFKKKNKIESSHEMEKDLEEKDKLIDQKQEEVQKIRQEQQDLLREKDRLEYQLQSLDERMKKVKDVAEQNKEQLSNLQKIKTDFKHATLRLNACLDQDSSFASQLANARRKIVDLQDEHAKLNAKTVNIQAGLSADRAVNSILENKKEFKGVFGTVAELGQANKKYAQALETAAGSRMKNIIVDNDKTAADCINYLKSNRLGSASFIPLNKIRSTQISSEDKKLLKSPGVEDFALNLINYKPQFQDAFAYVFGNTLVVDDINTARKVGVGRIKMTTLDGNSIEASGVMRGGFMVNKSSLGFKEQDSLDKLEKLQAEVAELQGVVSNVETKRAKNEEEISALRNSKGELEGEIIKLEKTLHLETGDLEATTSLKKELNEQLKEVDQNLNSVRAKVMEINKDLANLKMSKQNLRSEVNQLRNPRLLAQLSAFEESKQNCREELVRLENDLKNAGAQIAQMIGPEKQKIMDILKQHEKEEEQFTKEIKELSERATVNEKDLEGKEKESKEFYSTYRSLFNEREKLGNEINSSENNIEQLREKSRDSEREINLISLKSAEVRAQLSALKDEFEKYKEFPLLKDRSVKDLQLEINRFEIMLGQMSAVNMKALEIYEKVESEHQKLEEKRESLIKEKTDVLTLMNEIETKKKDNFMKTFNLANQNFSNIFSTLFSKGKAYLQLDNPNNPFEDGLSIKVRLHGNRFMDIKSLSGGEKTMTALSFIFAIQEYQPASFYILDEIDAALDKHNAETLAKLVRNYCDNAQYIVISHNDAVISEADNLYGISMDSEGMSKVTSLKI